MSSRRLRRFFTSDYFKSPEDTVLLTPSDTEHLRRTLRMKAGDLCLVTSGNGLEAEAVVADTVGLQVKLLIQKVMPRKPVKGLQLFVYPAIIQKGKTDELVRQMQELGVEGFFPLETERTIVKMSGESKGKVLERWEKITQEAVKQSGAFDRMQCDAPRPLQNIMDRLPKGDALALFHPGKNSLSFREWVKTLDLNLRMHLFLGPEGGFSEKEAILLESRGAVRVGLGDTILKADTALLGTAAALKFLFQ